MTEKIILLSGPTATGKSSLALKIAETIGAEIINADSIQLYRDLSILTARPNTENEKIKQTTEKIILALKKYHVEIKIKEIQEKIKLELPDEKILFELKSLIKLKIKISKSLGRNIG